MLALAAGLAELGLGPGDYLAIIGRNRPRLYWAMVAAQMLRRGAGAALPGRGGRGDGLRAGALRRALRRGGRAGAGRQGAGDRSRLPRLEQIVYLDPRGLRNYDHARLHRYTEVQDRGARGGRRGAARADRGAGRGGHLCDALHLRDHRAAEGVVLSNRNIMATAQASAAFDRLTPEDSVLAYLPMAWVGDFIFSMGQAWWAGFCVACPESPETMRARPARDRADLLLRAAAVLRGRC